MDKIYFLFILFTSNNIFITLTNFAGKVIFWRSLGKFKTKGLRKLTPLLNKFLVKDLFFLLTDKFYFHIRIKGSNKCKKSLLKSLFSWRHFNNVLSLTSFDSYSNNGCKLKKSRRL